MPDAAAKSVAAAKAPVRADSSDTASSDSQPPPASLDDSDAPPARRRIVKASRRVKAAVATSPESAQGGMRGRRPLPCKLPRLVVRPVSAEDSAQEAFDAFAAARRLDAEEAEHTPARHN
eukprot:gene22194-38558_t